MFLVVGQEIPDEEVIMTVKMMDNDYQLTKTDGQWPSAHIPH